MSKPSRAAAAVLLAGILAAFCLAAAPVQAGNPLPQQSVSYVGSLTLDEEAGPLYYPFSTFGDRSHGEVYVIDGKARVIIYNANLFPLLTIRKGSGVFSPTAVVVDPAGNVYVAQSPGKDSPRSRISVLDACLKPVRQVFFSGFEGADKFVPDRIAWRSGRLYAVGSGALGIVVIEPGGPQRLINPAAKDVEGNPYFSALYVDEAGLLYAVGEEAGRVYVLDGDLKTVRAFGQKGGSAGKLSRPQGVAADPARGLFYVVDYMRHGVSIYDAEGNYLSEFGGLGVSPGWFQFPKDIAIDAKGRVFIVDTFNQRVQVFEVEPAVPAKAEPQKAPAPAPAAPLGPPATTAAPPPIPVAVPPQQLPGSNK
jgi:DNA-binding beta-propeller fold protein YncE